MKPSSSRAWLLAWAIPALALLVVLHAWQAHAYWDYSDGVYSASAQAIAGGAVPYRDFAAAQPPLFLYLGALLVEIHDGIGWLRIALAGVDLALAALVTAAVLRLTGRRGVAVLAGLGALVTPWALHEHAQLLPETFGAPLLLGAALAASRRRTSTAAGMLLALALLCKLAFAPAALAVALGATAPRRVVAATAAATLALAALALALFGDAVVRGTVVAQLQTGSHALDTVGGLWLQAAWNLAVLAVPAALAWPLRHRTRDAALLRSVAALAAGTLVLLAGLLKDGSYLNALVPIEPPLLILAVAGSVWTAEAWRARGRDRAPRPRAAARARRRLGAGLALAAAALALWIVQDAALVARPDDPRGFTRPLSAPAHGRLASAAAMRDAVAAAHRCPATDAYGGPAAVAFRAHLPLAGNQPDVFILRAPTNARFRAVRGRELPACVGRPPSAIPVR